MMVEISITDSEGNRLVLTNAIHQYTFDAVTCSPRTDGGFGFSMLPFFLGRHFRSVQLEAACMEAVARNEVCVLPVSVSAKQRVLLTPTIRSSAPETREFAARLMMDLLAAAQSPNVSASGLLITHFHYVKRYPEAHVAGIFDALEKSMKGSFVSLRVLGFDVASEQFERQVLERFDGNKGRS